MRNFRTKVHAGCPFGALVRRPRSRGLPMVGRISALAVSLVVLVAAIGPSGWANVAQPFLAQATGGGNPSCEAPIDLLLVLDGSGSIFARDFRTMQGFSQDVAGSFVISPGGAHVGVVQFSGEGQGRLA